MPLTPGEHVKVERKIQELIDEFPVEAASFIECCDMMIDMAGVAADACREDEEAKAPDADAE